jgi:5'-nucleotidase
MHILLTNDDGVSAPGLFAIYKKLTKIAKVSVVAPSEVKSGASHSISLNPITYDLLDLPGKFTAFSVHGSPADCVKLAVNNLIKEPIDLVVSGINHGANVGIHVYYSGTVAAAMEAAFYGIPALALSAAFEEDLDIEAAAQYAFDTIEKLLPLKPADVININIPQLTAGKPKGTRIVPHSVNGYHETYTSKKDEDGRTFLHFTGGGYKDMISASTDTTFLFDGYITVTALHFDLTDYSKNLDLESIDFKDY